MYLILPTYRSYSICRIQVNIEQEINLHTPLWMMIAFRALPSISLKHLRDEISEQLDCSLFPSAFVFLKSIGKCLTWVSLIFDLHSHLNTYM
jgi:hypothetical protein